MLVAWVGSLCFWSSGSSLQVLHLVTDGFIYICSLSFTGGHLYMWLAPLLAPVLTVGKSRLVAVAVQGAPGFLLARVTPVTPQLIIPVQQLQALCSLGRRLRDIVEDRNPEQHLETVKWLESIDKIPVRLRRLKHLMKRQLRRLQDLRDGGGFGFTVELFFLALRQLSSVPLSDEEKKGFYIGNFKAITTHWADSKHSFGTHGILLDVICDIVIRRRGIFSDFSYPGYILDELLELVKKMVDGQGGSRIHIDGAVQELRDVQPRDCMDRGLRDMALMTICLL